MKKNRDFHKHCRVVYRAMRKKYGKEKVQDECLRVFKVVYPLLIKAKNGEEHGFPADDIKKTQDIFTSWNVKKGSNLDNVLLYIINRMGMPFSKEAFILFCEDILPVVMRIRKLTPRECYRLQGVNERQIDILLSSGISKSAHYKLAGNSITSGGNHMDEDGNWDGPLFNIFRKLLVERGEEHPKGQAVQLSLF